jgi:hypothetical protein
MKILGILAANRALSRAIIGFLSNARRTEKASL